MKTILLIFALTLFSFFQGEKEVGEKVVEFSKKNFGKKVDRGECWDLAAKALDYANAKWEAPNDFGLKIDIKKENVKPGDIMQFENVKFKGKFYSSSFPHHTAVAYKVKDNDILIFHQNYNNKKKVDTLTLHMNDLASGKIDFYRPLSK